MGPRWPLAAALRALGFATDRIALVAEGPGPDPFRTVPEERDRQAGLRFVDARSSRTGVLYLTGDDLDANAAIPSDGHAFLYVRSSAAQEHDVGLDWLTQLGIFDYKVDDAAPG